MNVKDKKILFELDLNGRAPMSKIAKKTALSKESVARRIKKLESQNIIQGYNAIINIAKLGYTQYTVCTRLTNLTDEIKAELIKSLRNNKKVFWVATLGGNYDLFFGIQASNIVEFTKIYNQIKNEYHDYMEDNVISIRSQVTQFPRTYLLENPPATNTPLIGKEFEIVESDQLDKDILNELSVDARISTLELAEKLQKPRTTIRNRIVRMEKEGIIQGYAAKIHPEKYGQLIYQLMITMNQIDEREKNRFYTFCHQHKNINFFIEAVGQWTFELSSEVKDNEELQELLHDMRTAFPKIMRVEIILTFDVYIKYQLYAG